MCFSVGGPILYCMSKNSTQLVVGGICLVSILSFCTGTILGEARVCYWRSSYYVIGSICVDSGCSVFVTSGCPFSCRLLDFSSIRRASLSRLSWIFLNPVSIDNMKFFMLLAKYFVTCCMSCEIREWGKGLFVKLIIFE